MSYAPAQDLGKRGHNRLERIAKMTDSNNLEAQLERLTDSIADLKQDVDTRFNQVDTRFNQIDTRLNSLESKIKESELKIEAYQKASNQDTNLAFGLIITASLSIITAAITIIIPAVTKLSIW